MAAVHEATPIFAPLANPEDLASQADGFQKQFQVAVKLYEAEKYDQALIAFEAVARLNPNEAEAHYGRGISLAHLGRDRYRESLDAFDVALSLQPDLGKAHSARGVVLGLLNQNTEALSAFEAALSLRSQDPKAHADLGMTLAVLGRYQEAFVQLDEAATLGLKDETVLAARRVLLKARLRGLGATGGKEAWLSGHDIGAKRPLILKPGAPTVSQAVVEDRG